MEPYTPYREVFLTYARLRILYSLGSSARPYAMLGQPLAVEGGCSTRPAPTQPLAEEEGKEEVPEEEGEEEVPEEEKWEEDAPEEEKAEVPDEEEGAEEVSVEEEGAEEVPKKESFESCPEPEVPEKESLDGSSRSGRSQSLRRRPSVGLRSRSRTN